MYWHLWHVMIMKITALLLLFHGLYTLCSEIFTVTCKMEITSDSQDCYYADCYAMCNNIFIVISCLRVSSSPPDCYFTDISQDWAIVLLQYKAKTR